MSMEWTVLESGPVAAPLIEDKNGTDNHDTAA